MSAKPPVFRFWHILLLLMVLAWASSAAAEPGDTKTKDAASQMAVKYVRAWSKKDYSTLKPLVDFPFALFLACKNAPIQSWKEFTDRMGPLPKVIRVKKVVTVATYLRSLGGTKEQFRHALKKLGDGVYAVYFCKVNREDESAALLVRVQPQRVRVVGIGIVPSTKP